MVYKEWSVYSGGEQEFYDVQSPRLREVCGEVEVEGRGAVCCGVEWRGIPVVWWGVDGFWQGVGVCSDGSDVDG